MTLAQIAKQVEKFTVDNSPAILTAVGVAGTLTTAWLTGKATFKAAKIIADADFENKLHEVTRHSMTRNEKIKLVWKQYIPVAASAAVTVGCTLCANRIGMRRAAAVAAAYSLSQDAFIEYKNKVVERFGDSKEQGVRDEIAQDRVNRTPGAEIIITGDNQVLCFDEFTGRYFNSTVETLKKAQNDCNYRLMHDGYVSLDDFYDKIGLPGTTFTSENGWNTDRQIELTLSTILSQDGRPCISVGFDTVPIRDYFRTR